MALYSVTKWRLLLSMKRLNLVASMLSMSSPFKSSCLLSTWVTQKGQNCHCFVINKCFWTIKPKSATNSSSKDRKVSVPGSRGMHCLVGHREVNRNIPQNVTSVITDPYVTSGRGETLPGRDSSQGMAKTWSDEWGWVGVLNKEQCL